ncbi:MAG: SUMF1/EgtB/PvdO family nonheme iron enzyme [Muribaculaceae bacterium]|nr:SUMF1/EgtB/PvdO family nonheme iron enzyme [Muribaculaceae bacterium]
MKNSINYMKTAVMAFLACAALFPLSVSSQTLRGDFNMDGEVNISDAISMANCLLNDSPGELTPDDRDTLMLNGVPVVMVRVKAGTYTIRYGDVRTVERDFWIGQTEVTYGLWWTVMGREEVPTNEIYRNHAVQGLGWNQCQVFIDSLNRMTGMNFRAPTVTEWMFAATGGRLSRGYDYSGSNDINEVAWYKENYRENLNSFGLLDIRVATKAPNELGLYDMSGNVSEFCWEPGSSTSVCLYGGNMGSTADLCRPHSHKTVDASDDIPFQHKQYAGLRLVLPVEE